MQTSGIRLLRHGGLGTPPRIFRRQTCVLASQYGQRKELLGAKTSGRGGVAGRGGSRLPSPRGRSRPVRDDLEDSDDSEDDDDDDAEEDGFLEDERPRRRSAPPASTSGRLSGPSERTSSFAARAASTSAARRGSSTARAGDSSEGEIDPEERPSASTARATPSGSSRPRSSVATASSAAGRRPAVPPPPPRPPPPPQAAVSGPKDAFDLMHERLSGQIKEGFIVRKESWEKLFGHMQSPRQAHAALQLMLEDAAARDATSWDWATHGYGQAALQLVQAAAECGAPEVAEYLLERREALHITLNKDLVPGLMRKIASAMTPAGGRDPELDEQVEAVQRLYEQEAALRGGNSPEAAYELSRVLRRAGDARGVQALHGQIVREGLAVRTRLMEDMERWLAKRGVRV